MRYAPQRAGSFAGRRPPPSPQQRRAAWVIALEQAAAIAGMAASEGCGDPDPRFGLALSRFKITLRDLEATGFPIQADSARTMAAAFLALARGFAHPAWTGEARTACAPFLAKGAQCLDGLLDDLRRGEAEQGRRVLGERD